MSHFDLADVQRNLEDMIEQALHGEEVVITQADRPVLKLVRIETKTARRKRGSAKGQIQMAPDFDAPLEDFQSTMT